jgi:hypothetical protein
MKYLKTIQGKTLVAIGLLLITVPTLLRDFIPVPHFWSGFLVGVGLVIEITGLVKLKKEKDEAKRNIVNE